jgi:hypothetical protein
MEVISLHVRTESGGRLDLPLITHVTVHDNCSACVHSISRINRQSLTSSFLIGISISLSLYNSRNTQTTTTRQTRDRHTHRHKLISLVYALTD